VGLDLKLLPMSCEYEKRDAFSHDVLDVDCRVWPVGATGDDCLSGLISELPSKSVPPGFWSHLGPIVGDHRAPHQDDAYSEELRWVAAGDLAKLARHPTAGATPRNLAAFAYIATLPAHWPVVLYWC
jgi:hypothetical protein